MATEQMEAGTESVYPTVEARVGTTEDELGQDPTLVVEQAALDAAGDEKVPEPETERSVFDNVLGEISGIETQITGLDPRGLP